MLDDSDFMDHCELAKELLDEALQQYRENGERRSKLIDEQPV